MSEIFPELIGALWLAPINIFSTGFLFASLDRIENYKNTPRPKLKIGKKQTQDCKRCMYMRHFADACWYSDKSATIAM